MQWLDSAQNLPLGQKTRIDCPDCGEGTQTNAAILNHTAKGYSLYCCACGFNPFRSKGVQTLEERKKIADLNANVTYEKEVVLPDDIRDEIPLIGRLWLYKASISDGMARRLGIGWSERLQRVILPVHDADGNLIWYQGRAVHAGQKPKYLQPSRDRREVMYTRHRLLDDRTPCDSSVAIIVEDIASAIRVCLAGFKAYSLLGTKLTTEQLNRLAKYKRVVTWLDGDRAGKDGAYNIRRSLSMLTEVENIQTELDPKEYSNVQINQILEKYL